MLRPIRHTACFYESMFALGLLATLVAGPAMVGLFLAGRHLTLGPQFLRRKLQVGAPIIYRKLEISTCPSRDAYQVRPAEKGEFYYYLTNKYWRVEAVQPDGWIVARSPLMETHLLRRDDPNLHRATLFERLRYAPRFPFLA